MNNVYSASTVFPCPPLATTRAPLSRGFALPRTDIGRGAQAWVREGGALKVTSGEGGGDVSHPNTCKVHSACQACLQPSLSERYHNAREKLDVQEMYTHAVTPPEGCVLYG